jgi:hypothetical protein
MKLWVWVGGWFLSPGTVHSGVASFELKLQWTQSPLAAYSFGEIIYDGGKHGSRSQPHPIVKPHPIVNHSLASLGK